MREAMAKNSEEGRKSMQFIIRAIRGSGVDREGNY